MSEATAAIPKAQPVASLTEPINVRGRLQALFPTGHTNAGNETSPTPAPPVLVRAKASHQEPKFLKVRIITWNMQTSLPKGDLEGLLGAVTPIPPATTHDIPGIPYLSTDENHPYHLIVVAGQECPSATGIIPMGLGAGFKLNEREKEREKERDKSREQKARDKRAAEEEAANHTSGWTAILDDWFCHGGMGISREKARSERSSPVLPAKPAGTIKGPYVPVIKHRMMGLYLAVYCHRDMKSFIQGSSKSAVTAGLIGGRVGNKGGLGISLNVDGVSFLFLNAHLAAHEGKVPHRLANLAKIKSELTVNDFLRVDDPRVMAEDITDKFDYTFLCGDLNFRLDVSRLHADWLISRQEYAQALAFDQLRRLMETSQAFAGFNEAPITFPPTFKYDVMHTFKGHRSKKSVERPLNGRSHSAIGYREDEDDAEDDEDGVQSVNSSAWMSISSKREHLLDDSDDDMSPSTSSRALDKMNGRNSPLKINLATAAHKAKARFKSMLSPGALRSSPELPTVDPGMQAGQLPRVTVDPASPIGERPPLSRRSTGLRPEALVVDEDDDRQGVYDSSHKKRVPSWCDRILWKSTVTPEPEPEPEPEGEELHRPRTRMGQLLLHAFRPLRARQDSQASINSVEQPRSNTTATTPQVILQSEPLGDANLSPFSRHIARSTTNPPSPSPPIPQAPPLSARITAPVPLHSDLKRSASVGSQRPSPKPRSVTMPSPTHSPESEIPNHEPTSALSKWRLLMPAFLHGGFNDGNTSPGASTNAPITPRPSRKGEVVCLRYDTLDDRGMRKLEGRSDHRPVVGTYAVYI